MIIVWRWQETIQAIGRGRLIWGKKKDIFLFSKESMGGDVEIKKFFRKEDIFGKKKKYATAVSNLKSLGYCRNNKSDLIALGLNENKVNTKRADIDNVFIKSGIDKMAVSFKNKDSKDKNHEYYVWNKVALEDHIAESGGKGIEIR
jgi:hypothetical protein